MFRIAGAVIIVLLFGCWNENFSKASPEKVPDLIFLQFKHNCTGNKEKLSNEVILKIRKAHSKWLENPTASDGYRANFCEADLVAADFRMAMLKGADFRMAMLAGANFTKAKLHKAQMDGANLTRANFSEAQLQGANWIMPCYIWPSFKRRCLIMLLCRMPCCIKPIFRGQI
jgi:uncharacterized protein YjbI with pentapeptide repeats